VSERDKIKGFGDADAPKMLTTQEYAAVLDQMPKLEEKSAHCLRRPQGRLRWRMPSRHSRSTSTAWTRL